MPIDSIRRYYRDEEFTALQPGFAIDDRQVALLRTAIGALALSQPVADVRRVVQGESTGVVVEWQGLPSAADITLINGAVQAFTGAATTSEPFELNSFAAATAANSTLVTKIDHTTPPLEPGTYQVCWCSSIRMQGAAANTGARGFIRLTREGTSVEQESHNDLTVNVAFNGTITFKVQAGQTIRALLQFAKVGGGAPLAEMSGARVTIDQIAAAA